MQAQVVSFKGNPIVLMMPAIPGMTIEKLKWIINQHKAEGPFKT